MHFLTLLAIQYTIKHLLRVACPECITNLSFEIADDRRISTVTIDSKKMIFKISDSEEISKLLSGTLILKQIPTADNQYNIPIILDSGLEFAVTDKDILFVNADIISLSFIMLSRYDETIVKQRDELGNFEFKNSIAFKYNFIDFPIVDEYAMILQSYLKIFFPKIKFKKGTTEIIPTHDIDEVFRYSSSFTLLRRLIGDTILHTSVKSFFRSIRGIILSQINKNYDPFFKSIETLKNVSQNLNLRSEFYFMAAERNKYNSGYSLDNPLIKARLIEILKANMIIGLHGGFGTRNNTNLLIHEKETLQKYSGTKILNGRQHYLHFDIHTTYKVLEAAGLVLDSTLGYNEQEGFRCGTCYEFHPWDFVKDQEIKLIERPLIVMDITLFSSKTYSKAEALNSILKLYARCQAVGGKFVILWHNAYVEMKTDWFKEVYIQSLEKICANNKADRFNN